MEGLINNQEKWNGKVFIISDSGFMKEVTEAEYRLYIALKSISYHDNNGSHFLYKDQCEFSKLSRELELENGLNKNGEIGYMTRKTISKLFKSLEDKGILKYEELFDGKFGYKIITEENYTFVQVDNTTIRHLSKAIKGQPLKMYMYLKGIFDSNGRKEFKINRITIAKAINEISKKGDISTRQLDNITSYMTIFYNLNLIDVEVSTKKEEDKYISIYKIKNVTDKLKKVPRAKK